MKNMPTTLIDSSHQDPIARMALIGLLAAVLFVVVAMPAMPVQSQPIIILPTQSLEPRLSAVGQDMPASMATLVPTQVAPTAPPTEVPAAQAAEAVPTLAPPEPVVVYVEVTAEPPPEPDQPTPLPDGTIIILPTQVQASDFAPPPDRCANPMIGALHCPTSSP